MARKKQTFDEAMERLEEIVEQLEQEEVSLETAVSLYKEGLTLATFCREKLSAAEGEIVLLRKKQGFGRRSRFRRRWKNDGFEAGNEGTLCLY